VLGRGYSLTFGPDGRILRTVEGLGPGDTITSRLHRGEIVSEVNRLQEGRPSDSEEGEDDT
jgi:exodeoxyribonuclease VII large subunit